MWFSDGAKTKFNCLDLYGRIIAEFQLSYELLIGIGYFTQSSFETGKKNCFESLGEKFDVDMEFNGSFTKYFQDASEPYAKFPRTLRDAIWSQVKGKEIQQLLT